MLLFFSLGIGCSIKTSAKNSIPGEIKSLPKGTLQLTRSEAAEIRYSKLSLLRLSYREFDR